MESQYTKFPQSTKGMMAHVPSQEVIDDHPWHVTNGDYEEILGFRNRKIIFTGNQVECDEFIARQLAKKTESGEDNAR